MPVTSLKRSIFRSKTMQKYMQNREKSVLPRFVAPSVFAFCWIILALLIAAGVSAWFAQVPLYLTGSGVILEPSANANDEATAAILLPASDIAHLRSGLPILLQIGPDGLAFRRDIDVVKQNLLSPGEIRQNYGLEATEPSLVVTVGLGSAVSAQLYAGSLVQAQIRIGSQSLLAFFPVVDNLVKNS